MSLSLQRSPQAGPMRAVDSGTGWGPMDGHGDGSATWPSRPQARPQVPMDNPMGVAHSPGRLRRPPLPTAPTTMDQDGEETCPSVNLTGSAGLLGGHR